MSTGLAGMLLLILLAVLQPGFAATEFEWAGFGTIGAGQLDDDSINRENLYGHNLFDEDLDFDIDTRIGFQGEVSFDERFSATLQVVSFGVEDYDPEVEWAYLSYNLSEAAKLRIGRLRRPFYAQSEYLPVGYVYPWIRPPLEVYSPDLTIFDNLDAIDLLYRSGAGSWNLTTEVYFGESSEEAEIGPGEEGDHSTSNDFGIVLTLEKDGLSLRFGYHRSPDIDVETRSELEQLFGALDAAGFSEIVDDMRAEDFEGEFYSLSVGFDYENWIAATELVYIPLEDSLAPDEESWYVMGGRRFGRYTLHLTYGEREREVDEDFAQPVLDQAAVVPFPLNQGLLMLADGIEQAIAANTLEYHSYTLGLRYDFDQPVSLKVEYQHIVDDINDLSNNLLSASVDFLF